MTEAPYPSAEPPADSDWASQGTPGSGTPRYSASASVPVPPAPPAGQGAPGGGGAVRRTVACQRRASKGRTVSNSANPRPEFRIRVARHHRPVSRGSLRPRPCPYRRKVRRPRGMWAKGKAAKRKAAKRKDMAAAWAEPRSRSRRPAAHSDDVWRTPTGLLGAARDLWPGAAVRNVRQPRGWSRWTGRSDASSDGAGRLSTAAVSAAGRRRWLGGPRQQGDSDRWLAVRRTAPRAEEQARPRYHADRGRRPGRRWAAPPR